MPSPTCQVKEGAGAYQSTTFGVDVSVSGSITIKLADITDVDSWSIQCVTTDDTNVAASINGSLSVDNTTKTATFTAPAAAGAALRFRSVVNNGLDVNGVVDDDLSTTFCIYVRTPIGRRVLAMDETIEGHPDFGWIQSLNKIIRDFSIVFTSDATPALAKRYPVANGDVRLIRSLIKVQSADGSGAVRGEWDVRAAYRRVSGTLAQEYAPVITPVYAVGGPGGPTLSLNGNTDVDLKVTGVLASNLVWTVSDVAL